MELTFKTVFFATLALFLLALYCYYWKIQLMYNSSALSLYTPDTFQAPENLKIDLEKRITRGSRFSKQKRVVIASLVRDVADRIPEIRKKAERMGKLFGDYHILIVENDSKDGTREKLLEWARQNPKVTILGCGYNSSTCSIPKTPKTEGHGVDRARIEKMVYLRNIYLDEIKKNFGDWDYSIFWDMDMISSVYLDGVCHSMSWFQDHSDVDAICSFGIYRWGLFTLFYDTYAKIDHGDVFHIDLKTIHDIKKGLWETSHKFGEDPTSVESCFSGFTVYRTESLLPDNVFYDMSGPDSLDCEHVRLHMKMKGKKLLNPNMVHFVIENS